MSKSMGWIYCVLFWVCLAYAYHQHAVILALNDLVDQYSATVNGQIKWMHEINAPKPEK